MFLLIVFSIVVTVFAMLALDAFERRHNIMKHTACYEGYCNHAQ